MICKVKTCNKKQHSSGYCGRHYLQIWQHGRITNPYISSREPRKVIIKRDMVMVPLGPLVKNKPSAFAKVDIKYLHLVEKSNWRLTKAGYAINSKTHKLMHRIIMNADDKISIDHINQDKLDNRLSNLRLCTQAQNTYNVGIKSNNKTGYKGVSIYKLRYTEKFVANINKDGVKIYLGIFNTPEEAAIAYNKHAIRLFGEFAYVNAI